MENGQLVQNVLWDWQNTVEFGSKGWFSQRMNIDQSVPIFKPVEVKCWKHSQRWRCLVRLAEHYGFFYQSGCPSVVDWNVPYSFHIFLISRNSKLMDAFFTTNGWRMGYRWCSQTLDQCFFSVDVVWAVWNPSMHGVCTPKLSSRRLTFVRYLDECL